MPRGDRGKGLTLVEALFCALAVIGVSVIIWGTGQVVGEQKTRASYGSERHQDDAKRDAMESCPHIDREALVDCVSEKIESGRAASHDEQDLKAQQEAAWSAMVAAGVGVITLLISGFGLWALLRTIQQGDIALEKAREANEIAADTADRQLRAYLFPSTGNLKLIPEKITAKCPIRIPFTNAGATPATLTYYKIRTSITSGFGAVKNFHQSSSTDIAEVTGNIQKMIGPNGETYISIDGSVELKHFSKVWVMASGGSEFEVEFKATIEWHYSDYRNRVWRVDAVFTSDRFEWDGRVKRMKIMRQLSAKERQIR